MFLGSFSYLLTYFHLLQSDILYIKNVLETRHYIVKNFHPKRLLFLAYFWRFGAISLGLVLPIISWFIFSNIEVLQPYTLKAFLLSCGIPFSAMGIDYILGCIFEFDHMILINQDIKREPMDPYNLTWNVPKTSFIVFGSIFLLIGIGITLLSFFI